MDLLESFLLVLHLIVALVVCGLVLLQHGKGADMGAAFGSGSSGSLFGASGSANFLSRSTAVMAAVFFLTSMGLTYMISHKPQVSSVMDTPVKQQLPSPPPAAQDKPVESAPAPADSKAKDIPK